MPQPASPELVAAAVAAQAQTATLRVNLQDFIERLWLALGVYRAAQMRTFVGEIVPVVQGAQRQMAALTAAWLARQRQLAFGGNGVPRPVSIDKVIGRNVRNGTTPKEVYERAFHLVWRQLAELPHEPGAIEQAIEAGQKRAVQSALTDVQLTKRATARQLMESDKNVVGYRRFLEGTYSCGLCIVASTLRYHKADLLPIHPACDCGVVEIYGNADPGLTIESMVNVGTPEDPKLVHVADLPDVHARIQETFGKSDAGARTFGVTGSKNELVKYRDVIITLKHGELGPVIGIRGQHFVGPSEIPKHRSPKSTF